MTERFSHVPEANMSGYRGLSEPTHSVETDGEWVDFPASPDPDPWGTLLRQADLDRVPVSCGGHQDARPARGAMAISAAMALRGLLVTTTAVATIAYLLLTNTHI
jgi:hypothetical protein